MRLRKTVSFFLVLSCLAYALATPAHATLYDVKFKLKTLDIFESVTYEVDYSGAGGNFVGSGGGCVANGSLNLMAVFRNDILNLNLHTAFIALPGVTGPVRVVTCTFDAPVKPSLSDFTVTETDFFSPGSATSVWIKLFHIKAQ